MNYPQVHLHPLDTMSLHDEENITPPGARKRSAFQLDDDSFDDMSFDAQNDDDSDFEMEPAPKKAPAKKAPAKKAASKPVAKKSKSNASIASSSESTPAPVEPLQEVENKERASAPKTKKSASATYQKLTQLEHVLKRPDTYIGSVEHTETKMWVFDTEAEAMRFKTVKIVPGLYKIFDEILVNAADNKIRDPNMNTLNVEISPEENKISIYNNGKGIPIEIHEKEGIYIPELIFGNLLTSSNYDDKEEKVTGGRNGFGAKLCNIFSTQFTIETVDKNQEKKYIQTWNDHMSKCTKPKITKDTRSDSYTKITFQPDLALFGMDHLDDDIVGVMKRRVYDLAGSVADIKVNLNKQRIKIKNFKGYVDLFVKALQEQHKEEASTEEDGAADVKPPTVVYEKFNDRWEIAFAKTDGAEFQQVSFVNSIATTSGGTHVNYIADQLVGKIADQVKKKNRNMAAVKPSQIRSHLFIFINCLIVNPAFTSQTKEQLTTKISAFGSKCELTDAFTKKVFNTGVLDSLFEVATRNADKELKKLDGGKKKRITAYSKLDDANKAGTRESHLCTLILTEGDSAKALAVAGLAVVGRDYYGVFPLRGKLLNVRDASHEQIMKNAEIQAIKQIVGLQHKKEYKNVSGLRYGHIMIMTDQDHDGSHIKGLIINFLETSFPGLLEVEGFLLEFITPIVKVRVMRGKTTVKTIPFYTMPQYEEWRDTEGKTCAWKQKYYKGLGSSDLTEGREYFSELDKHQKIFEQLRTEDKPCIELAFGKSKADARKDWLRNYQPGTHLDPDLVHIPISDFINKELILFSMADNIRSIPSVMDGFKPGQRKIMYATFKRNLTSQIKVSQLGGYVSETTAYHHGETSLNQTIIGLAQDFVGTNNIYFLMPRGSFGTRQMGGKDSSDPRYPSTELNELTRKIFAPDDDLLLNYLDDDEMTVEPEWYVPILPTLLINGTEGIGTGWSTSIPSYNPLDIVENLKRMMNGEELVPMVPWYRGWTGTIEQIQSDKYRVTGRAEQIDETTVEITELPVKMWTQTMKDYLMDALIKGKERNSKEWIEDFTEEHGVGIKFVITLNKATMEKVVNEGILQKFKLVSTMSTANMVAFDPQGRLKKYDSPEAILREFYYVRLEYYQRRKDVLCDRLKNQLDKISNQARFVKMIIEGKLVVNNRKKIELISELERERFPRFGKNGKPIYPTEQKDDVDLEDISMAMDEEIEDAGAAVVEVGNDENVNKPSLATYDYLLGMPLWNLTRERYEKLLQQRDGKEEELTLLLRKSSRDLWMDDLDAFVPRWLAFEEEDQEKREALVIDGPKKKGKKKAARKPKKSEDDDDDDFDPKKPKKKASSSSAAASSKATKGKVKQEAVAKQEPITNASGVTFGSGSLDTYFGSPASKKDKENQMLNPDTSFDFKDLSKGFDKAASVFGVNKGDSSSKGSFDDPPSPVKSIFSSVNLDDSDDDFAPASTSIKSKPEKGLTNIPELQPQTQKPKRQPAKTAKTAKTTTTTKKKAESDEELELSDAPVEEVAPRARRGRGNTKKNYVVDLDLSDESDSGDQDDSGFELTE